MTHLTSPDGTAASRFAFGTMQFGGRADAATSRALFDASRAAGINHFDTADVYNGGASETVLAPMIVAERDALVIATKFGSVGGASAANMTARFDASRKRLGMDMIDLLYLHRFDDQTDLRNTMEGFAHLKQAGQIRYIGLSNFAAWQVMKAIRIAAEFDLTIDVLQPMYNLVKRQAEVEILPMSVDQGVAVVPYSPLGGGLLTGKYAGGTAGRLTEDTMYGARYGQEWMHETARNLNRLAQEQGCNPATLAAAWVAAHPANVSPILSARSPEQLQPSLAAINFPMTAELYDEISALSPTPAPATDRSEEI